jgi:hypothetical protein
MKQAQQDQGRPWMRSLFLALMPPPHFTPTLENRLQGKLWSPLA